MRDPIAKGAIVRVCTTNNGELTAQLYERYRPTYDVVLIHDGSAIVIPAIRLSSVEAATAQSAP